MQIKQTASYCLVLVLLVCMLISCKSSKSSVTSLPEWITQGVSDPYYYKGVGHVVKVKNGVGYEDRANKLALQSLSEEISIQLKSSSLLVSIEKDNVLAEDFSQIVQVRATNDIEGYERFAVYETEDDYYVGYRLSRSLYEQKMRERREKAVSLARYYYNQATAKERNGLYIESFLNYVQSIDAIKGYMNELITISATDNRNLVKESYDKSVYILENIKILPIQSELIEGRYGLGISTPFCKALYDGNPVDGMPVTLTYSEISMPLGKVMSDANGVVFLNIGKIRSKRMVEEVRATIDVESLLQRVNVDYVLRKWLLQHSYASLTVNIQIHPASIYIVTSEKKYGVVQSNGVLYHSIETFLSESNYQVVNSQEEADFLLYLQSDVDKVGFNNGLYTSKLVGKYDLRDKNGKILINKTLLPILGTQLSYSLAGDKAYSEAAKQLKNRMIYDIESAIIQL